MDKKLFGRKLYQLRRGKGLTSETLSEKVDVTSVFIRQIESGKSLPSLSNFVDICNALDASPNVMLANEIRVNDDDAGYEEIHKLIMSLTPNQLKLFKTMIATIQDLVD